MKKHIVFLLLLLLGVYGCGSDQTLETTTIIEVNLVTESPSNAPIISSIEGQTIYKGEIFSPINLTEFVSDPDHTNDQIIWERRGMENLWAYISDGTLIIRIPSREWIGAETIVVKACDPDGQCDEIGISFTVAVDTRPIVSGIRGQTVVPGEKFMAVHLNDYMLDGDTSDEDIVWSVSGQGELKIDLEDNTLTVSAPDDWRGSEKVAFEACDPDNQCTAVDAVYKVMNVTEEVVITYINNAGFMISSGDTKVLIDAITDIPISDLVDQALESAQPPFDEIDLVMVTHVHGDHFERSKLDRFMQNSPETVLLGTPQVVSLQAGTGGYSNYSDRVVSIDLNWGESISVVENQVPVEIYYLPHGEDSNTINYGYLFEVGGLRFLHLGDLSGVSSEYLKDFGFHEMEIDVLFIAGGACTVIHDSRDYMEEVFHFGKVVLMHAPRSGDIAVFQEIAPDVLWFESPLERWVIEN